MSENEKPWSKPVNYLDEQAKYHDIRFYKIKHDNDLNDELKLYAKHKAAEMLIEAIAKNFPTSLKERYFRLVIITA